MSFRAWCVVAVIGCATPAAASGLSVEVGPGTVVFAPGGELGLSGIFSLKSGGAIEVKARGALSPFNFVSVLTVTTLGVRYRTPTAGNFFTFAFGGGLLFSFQCLSGDFCGGFGPYAGVSPTFHFDPSPSVRLFAALNADVGAVLLLGNPGFWFAGSLTLGISFDFTANYAPPS